MSHLIETRGVVLRPLSEAVGVEVVGLDLREEQPPEVIDMVRQAFAERHLLLVRDQDISFEQQIAFASWFGLETTTRLPKVFAVVGRDTELPSNEMYVSNVDAGDADRKALGENGGNNAGLDSGKLLMHSDYAWEEDVLAAITLYGIEVPREGGHTVFASAVRAASDLPPELREQVSQLHARQIWDVYNADKGTMSAARFTGGENYPPEGRYVHPLLLTHPTTGQEVLFVSELMTERIVDLPEDESEELLQVLVDRMADPSLRYEHTWRKGDLIVWDNIALQHGRTATPDAQPRKLRRAQLAMATSA